MRKILFCLSLIPLLLSSESVTVDLLTFDGESFRYSLPAVLDDESESNLPFLIFSFGKNLEKCVLDSFSFGEESTAGGFAPKKFEGNLPLSSEAREEPKGEVGVLSGAVISGEDSRTVKIFPFSYDGRTLKYYRKATLYFSSEQAQEKKDTPVYDYLIVCHADYDTAFERLKEWKEQRGLKTRIVTTDSIFTFYSGADSAEKLRNFIRSEHALCNFTYLLLGGDRATIPVRRMFAMDCNADYYTDEDSIPADIYYSALEGDFDSDDDGIYGEVEDSADLTQEILVGRILFDTIYYGPSPIITRIIDYEKTKNTEQLNRGIFMGMILWNPPFTPGGEAKEQIFGDIIPPSFHVLKFYEHWGHSGKLDILDSLDEGYGIVNHNGHGSFKGIWVDTLTSLSRGDMTGLTNYSKTGLFYSIGCWVGAFDRDNTTYNLHSITQNMQNSPTGGYISIITNSRYGWGAPGYPGLGVSDVLDYRFFEMLFGSDEKRPSELLRNLKDEIAPLSGEENLYRWHEYQLNYFGDPSTMIYTGYPESISVSLSKCGLSLTARITDISGSPVEGASVCFYRDSIICRGVSGSNGIFEAYLGAYSDSLLLLTVTGPMLAAFSETVDAGAAGSAEILLKADSVYSGAVNLIDAFNPSASDLNITLMSRFIDTSLTVPAGETLSVEYTPLSSVQRSDTLLCIIDGSMRVETLICSVNPTLIDFDTLRFLTTVFNAGVRMNHGKAIKNGLFRLTLNGSGAVLDTMFGGEFAGRVSVSEATGIPTGEDYLTAEAFLYSGDTLLSHSKEFMNNGDVSFHDDFDNDLSKWQYKTGYWRLGAGEELYCGENYSYLNGMNDTIVSNDFYVYPGTVCSLYMEAYLPSLEFIGSDPVFDLDGLFIKCAGETGETLLLDFISSGGALKSENTMEVKGWREYLFNNYAPVKSRLMLNFISDSVVTDSGIYIGSIKVKPKFYYAESTYITRDDKNVINRENVTYYLDGLEGEVTATIISIDGRVQRRYIFSDPASMPLSFTGLPSGVYFVIIKAENAEVRDKLIMLK